MKVELIHHNLLDLFLKQHNQQMQLNIRNKIRSLLRRKQEFFCLSYNWHSKQIDLHQTAQAYFQEIENHVSNGYVKRAELYLDEKIQIDSSNEYLIYLVSFGDFRRGKIVYGENPIAKGFGVCAFDFVYFFVEQKTFAQEKMKFRIHQLEKTDNFFYASLMKYNYSKLFGKNQLDHEQNTLSYQDQIKNSESAYYNRHSQFQNNPTNKIFSQKLQPLYPTSSIQYSDESLISEQM